MMHTRGYQMLLLIVMGSMDCFTTVIGILYFGAVELNPFIAGVVHTNLPAFVTLKLTTTVLVCLSFVQAEKILMKAESKTTKAYNYANKLLKLANMSIIAFLIVVVTNNLIVLLSLR